MNNNNLTTKYQYEIPKLYCLFKNGEATTLSNDIDNLFATLSKLRGDGHEYVVKRVAKNLTQNVSGTIGKPKGLNQDGTKRRDISVSKAIGDALERLGIMYNEVDWNSDWEWKTQNRIDKINDME